MLPWPKMAGGTFEGAADLSVYDWKVLDLSVNTRSQQRAVFAAATAI